MWINIANLVLLPPIFWAAWVRSRFSIGYSMWWDQKRTNDCDPSSTGCVWKRRDSLGIWGSHFWEHFGCHFVEVVDWLRYEFNMRWKKINDAYIPVEISTMSWMASRPIYIYIEWIFLELFSTKSLSWSLPFCSMIGFYVYGWCWWYIIESLCYQPYFSRMGSKSEARNPSPLRRRWVARSQCNSVTFEYANVDHFKISFKKGAPIFVHIISYHMFLHISFFHIFSTCFPYI